VWGKKPPFGGITGFFLYITLQRNSNKIKLENTMDNQNEKIEQRFEDGGLVVVPDELYKEFRNIFDMIKEAQQNLHKIADAMKPIDNGE